MTQRKSDVFEMTKSTPMLEAQSFESEGEIGISAKEHAYIKVYEYYISAQEGTLPHDDSLANHEGQPRGTGPTPQSEEEV